MFKNKKIPFSSLQSLLLFYSLYKVSKCMVKPCLNSEKNSIVTCQGYMYSHVSLSVGNTF